MVGRQGPKGDSLAPHSQLTWGEDWQGPKQDMMGPLRLSNSPPLNPQTPLLLAPAWLCDLGQGLFLSGPWSACWKGAQLSVSSPGMRSLGLQRPDADGPGAAPSCSGVCAPGAWPSVYRACGAQLFCRCTGRRISAEDSGLLVLNGHPQR